MKTVVKELPYEKVLELKPEKLRKPVRPGLFWRWLMRVLGKGELAATLQTCSSPKLFLPSAP